MCRAFAAGLSIYLSICLLCRYGYVLLHVGLCFVVALRSFVGCVMIVSACGPCHRAGWEALCSSILVVGLSHHGHGAEHNSFPCV
jgi:hypothetical protein